MTRRRTAWAVGAAVAAAAVVLGLVLTGNAHHSDGGDGSDGGTGLGFPWTSQGHGIRLTSVYGKPRLVVLDGVSGRVRVTADDDADTVTGTFHRDDDGPARLRATGDDGGTLTVLCGDGSGPAAPCAGDLALTLPAGTGLRLRQTSGETVLSGLGGELTLATTSDRLTATGLRPTRADVSITSGSADLGFTAAPAGLAVHAVSASAAVRLPARPAGGYAVTQAATSADIQVQLPPQAPDPTALDATPPAAAPHRVTLDAVSSSLAVLPA